MSSEPIVPRPAGNEMAQRIEMLRDEAEALGRDTLVYLLEIAMSEAQRIPEGADGETRDHRIVPFERRRPVRR